MRTFVQLGRAPLMETCPPLPFDSNEGELLGVGATPGSRTTPLNRSRLLSGRLVRLRSARAPLTLEVVVSIATSAQTVTCCETAPNFSDRSVTTAAPELSTIPSSTSVWNFSFSARIVYIH